MVIFGETISMHQKEVLFSIITICINEEKRIRKTLDSIVHQNRHCFEYIIKDGLSSDNTLSIINEYEHRYGNDLLKLYSIKDSGIYDAMNQALSKANGEYICFINAGDEFYDDHVIDKIYKWIYSNSTADFYYGDAVLVFPNGAEYSQSISYPFNRLTDRYALEMSEMGLIHQAIIAHKRCFSGGAFNTHYRLRAELDWYYRCIEENRKFCKLSFPVCKYSVGGMSEKVESIIKSTYETREIISSYGYDTSLYDEKHKTNDVSQGIYKLIYREWLSILQSGYSIREYLIRNNIKKIAVFGYGELGCHLINELNGSDITITCIIESKIRYQYSGIPIIIPEQMDIMDSVDEIIVTAIMHFNQIKSDYQDIVSYPMVSLADIISNAMEECGVER